MAQNTPFTLDAYFTTPIYYVNDRPHIGHCYTSLITDILTRLYAAHGFKVRMQTGTDEHGQKVEQAAKAKGINTMLYCNEISESFRELAVLMNFCCSYQKFDANTNFNCYNQTLETYKTETVSGNERGQKGPWNDTKLFNGGKNFIRTTEGRELSSGDITNSSLQSGRHIKSVQELWKKLEQNGFIYKGKYEGWYAMRDEAFYDENEITEIDGVKKAPSGAPVEWREEEAYFFKLSAFQEILLYRYLMSDKMPRYSDEELPGFNLNESFKKHGRIDGLFENSRIVPEGKLSEIISFLSGASYKEAAAGKFKPESLKDLCISRVNLDWGIPVPSNDQHKIYVWLDALQNYISALSEPGQNEEKIWQNIKIRNHVIGKDILRFHAIYWPAFLIAANCPLDEVMKLKKLASEQMPTVAPATHIHPDLVKLDKFVPTTYIVHGWWTNEGQKISKSLGNVINPLEEIRFILRSFSDNKYKDSDLTDLYAIDRHDLAVAVDYFRYFLIRAMPMGNDGDYSRKKLVETINSDLCDNIGNLVSRVVSLGEKAWPDMDNYDGWEDYYYKKIGILFDSLDSVDPYNFLLGEFQSIVNFIHSSAGDDITTDNLWFHEAFRSGSLDTIAQFFLRAGDLLNKCIAKAEPWKLIKQEDKTNFYHIIDFSLSNIYKITSWLSAFCPGLGGMINDFLQGKENLGLQSYSNPPETAIWNNWSKGFKANSSIRRPFFPKLTYSENTTG